MRDSGMSFVFSGYSSKKGIVGNYATEISGLFCYQPGLVYFTISQIWSIFHYPNPSPSPSKTDQIWSKSAIVSSLNWLHFYQKVLISVAYNADSISTRFGLKVLTS